MVGDLLYQVWTGDSADDEVLGMVVRTGTSAFAFQLFLCLANATDCPTVKTSSLHQSHIIERNSGPC